ncbi:MAG: isoprenylcysteine carboxylmethyltransferase family protein [Acidobacteria bacterium]|nr:isoprenylcysteine carboxylmethyltransferase family protein [Acidobacteriota bacterium]MBV9476613.1 isoprenylcysteine carboxylmethyltransferase family protein [Acidobacteriota bacterium]
MTRAFALLRSFVMAAVFVSMWTWFFPRWIAAGKGVALAPRIGWPLIPMALGLGVMLLCTWEFGWTGHGTPAPFDPPRRFVARGCYRFVRNPMYAGMLLCLLGEAFLLPPIRNELFWLAAIFAGAVTLLVLLYEEPKLQRSFGDEYAAYRRHVHRWLPRLTPYTP